MVRAESVSPAPKLVFAAELDAVGRPFPTVFDCGTLDAGEPFETDRGATATAETAGAAAAGAAAAAGTAVVSAEVCAWRIAGPSCRPMAAPDTAPFSDACWGAVVSGRRRMAMWATVCPPAFPGSPATAGAAGFLCSPVTAAVLCAPALLDAPSPQPRRSTPVRGLVVTGRPTCGAAVDATVALFARDVRFRLLRLRSLVDCVSCESLACAEQAPAAAAPYQTPWSTF